MMKNWIQNNLLSNGKLISKKCLVTWFEKTGQLNVYNDVLQSTSYLNNPTFPQRIWHIVNDITIQPICKNCSLYDKKSKLCGVVVLIEGKKVNLPTEPNDHCFFDQEFTSMNEKGIMEKWKPEIQQIRVWCEKDGEKSEHGTMKIEFPKEIA